MAFLNKSMLKQKVFEKTVELHPLLQKTDIPLSVKQAYLQGCVLAALVDDEVISPDERSELHRLGASLQLQSSEIDECIETVSNLRSEEEKSQFVDEIIDVLRGDLYASYFLSDFQMVGKKNGVVPEEIAEFANYFGSLLTGRKGCKDTPGVAKDAVANPEQEGAGVSGEKVVQDDAECPHVPLSDEATKVLGIDFGNSFCRMAVYDKEGPVVLPNREGERQTPTAVAIDGEDQVLIGSAALKYAVLNPSDVVECIPRLLGRDFDGLTDDEKSLFFCEVVKDENGSAAVSLQGQVISMEVIAGLLLRKLKADAELVAGVQFQSAVIAIPVYYSARQKESLRVACEIAGLSPKFMGSSPVLAALCWSVQNKASSKFAVCDVGTGSVDVAIVDSGDGVVEVKSVNGNARVGGIDVDCALQDVLMSDFVEFCRCYDSRKDKVALRRLRIACAEAHLGANPIDLRGLARYSSGEQVDFLHTLNSNELEMFSRVLRGAVGESCKGCLGDAEVQGVDTLLLLGGWSKLPLVEESIRSAIKAAKVVRPQPNSEIVAMGAAIHAGIQFGACKDVLVLDVLPSAIGIETLGGEMTPVILRNTTIPTRKSQIFSTAADNQPAVTVTLYQGEHKAVKDCERLGSFNLSGIAPAPRGKPQIEVKFDVSGKGDLEVTAHDLSQDLSKALRVERVGAVSTEETLRLRGNLESLWRMAKNCR